MGGQEGETRHGHETPAGRRPGGRVERDREENDEHRRHRVDRRLEA